MRLAMLLLFAATPLAGAAVAQPPSGQTAQSPDVTVRAPVRMTCRAMTRTGTRMRTARTCRASGQARSPDEAVAEAADSLDTFGERISTGDMIDENLDPLTYRTPETPLGPR